MLCAAFPHRYSTRFDNALLSAVDDYDMGQTSEQPGCQSSLRARPNPLLQELQPAPATQRSLIATFSNGDAELVDSRDALDWVTARGRMKIVKIIEYGFDVNVRIKDCIASENPLLAA